MTSACPTCFTARMELKDDYPIGQQTTFGLPAQTRHFLRAEQMEDLHAARDMANSHKMPLAIIGGGSNILFSKDFPGLVVKLALSGVQFHQDGGDEIRVRVAAGEDWPSLVDSCLKKGFYGLENLSLIPGTAGAAPVQNIGAYGVELSQLLLGVEALDWKSGEQLQLTPDQCRFGYRDSVFKREPRDRMVITAIELKLHKQPRVNTSYRALAQALMRDGLSDPSPAQVARAVVRLRQEKLPDPAVLGNAGSFFKNPTVTMEKAAQLKDDFQGLVAFDDPQAGRSKIAAGWLIEHCGFKGLQRGPVGVHHQQALVLVNRGGAQASQVLELAAEIQQTVRDTFGLDLEIEPRVI